MERVEKQTALKEMMKKDDESGIYKQLTAVEFLVNHLDDFSEMTRDEKNNVIASARVIERDAIIEAHKQSSIESGFEDSAEDWANEYWERNFKSAE